MADRKRGPGRVVPMKRRRVRTHCATIGERRAPADALAVYADTRATRKTGGGVACLWMVTRRHHSPTILGRGRLRLTFLRGCACVGAVRYYFYLCLQLCKSLPFPNFHFNQDRVVSDMRCAKFCKFSTRLFMFKHPLRHGSNRLPTPKKPMTFLGAQRLAIVKARRAHTASGFSQLSLPPA